MPHSLPDALLQNASARATQPALRFKHLGIWQTRNWAEVTEDVRRLAAALHQRGFTAADSLVVISDACAEALLIALAAQWLGGSVRLLDPAQDNQETLAALAPIFAVAQGLEQSLQLRTLATAAALLVCLDPRGLRSLQDGSLIAYAELLLSDTADVPSPIGQEEGTAFWFSVSEGHDAIELTHGELLAGARRLIEAESLSSADEALAARVFAADGQARYLLTPWLLVGFCLNFPEALSTRDNDRRELGPTLVLGTRHSYGRLEQWTNDRLPLRGSFNRALYDWAMQPEPSGLRRFFGYWLIRRPLLDVLGMSRLTKPLLVGDPLNPHSQAFFAALGVQPRTLSHPMLRTLPVNTPPPTIPQVA